MSKIIKNIVKIKDKHNIEFYYCPKCRHNVYIISEEIHKQDLPPYCQNCGEDLDYDEQI